MTTPMPREWASNATFSGGAHAGAATKIDPGATLAGNGFYPDLGFGAEHINHELNAQSLVTRRALTLQLCKLREIRLEGTPFTDTAGSLAVISAHGNDAGRAGVLAIKTAQDFSFADNALVIALGVPASITSLVTGAAYDSVSGRILVVGTGGNRCTYSDTFGATWTAGGDIGATPGAVVRNSTASKFVAQRGSGLSSGADGTAWTFPGSVASEVAGGMAVRSNGDTVYIDAGSATVPAFRKVTAANLATTTSAATGGTVPNAASADENGYIAGDAAGTALYHVCRRSSGATLQFSSSTDGGATWGGPVTWAAPSATTYSSRPRVLVCQNTGLIFIVAPTTGLNEVRASADGGLTWTDPLYMTGSGVASYGAAGGRLVHSTGAQLFASDGIGW